MKYLILISFLIYFSLNTHPVSATECTGGNGKGCASDRYNSGNDELYRLMEKGRKEMKELHDKHNKWWDDYYNNSSNYVVDSAIRNEAVRAWNEQIENMIMFTNYDTFNDFGTSYDIGSLQSVAPKTSNQPNIHEWVEVDDRAQKLAEYGITAFDWVTDTTQEAIKTGIRGAAWMVDQRIEYEVNRSLRMEKISPNWTWYYENYMRRPK